MGKVCIICILFAETKNELLKEERRIRFGIFRGKESIIYPDSLKLEE